MADRVMSALFLLIILYASKVSSQNPYQKFFHSIGLKTDCPGNTTYNYSTDCSERCDNLDEPPEECKRLPYYGCTCKEGYIPLDTHRPLVCLRVEDCPANLTNTGCSGNTTFGSIPYFTKVCDPSNYHPMIFNRTRFFGCICKKGYIPLRYPFPPTCIKEEDCPDNDPDVVYTGLSSTETGHMSRKELKELHQKYGTEGPYQSQPTATTPISSDLRLPPSTH